MSYQNKTSISLTLILNINSEMLEQVYKIQVQSQWLISFPKSILKK